MDNRKMYVRPAVQSEDVLEQTSLACHATMPYPLMGQCFAGVQPLPNFAGVMGCLNDVSKGGAMDSRCDIVLASPKDIVVLS